MATAGPLETLVSPLDAVRRELYRLSFKSRSLTSVLADRERRLAFQATLGILVTFGLTCVAPAWMLALTPVILGVPHLASDARYLVVRQNLPRRWLYVVVAACAAMIGLRMLEYFHVAQLPFAQLEVGVAVAWVFAAAATGIRVSSTEENLPHRLPRVFGVLAILSGVGLLYPEMTRLVFAHVHNVVAIIVWAILFRAPNAARRAAGGTRASATRLFLLPLVLLVAALAVLLSGAPSAWAARSGGLSAPGLSMADAARALAPGLGQQLALGVALTYAFLQSVHYSVWLGWIPQEETRGEGTLTFRMTVRSLVSDFGTKGLWAIATLSGVVVVGALFRLTATRDLYFSLATFHGYFELSALAFLVCARPSRKA
jgi:hypothetical protein